MHSCVRSSNPFLRVVAVLQAIVAEAKKKGLTLAIPPACFVNHEGWGASDLESRRDEVETWVKAAGTVSFAELSVLVDLALYGE